MGKFLNNVGVAILILGLLGSSFWASNNPNGLFIFIAGIIASFLTYVIFISFGHVLDRLDDISSNVQTISTDIKSNNSKDFSFSFVGFDDVLKVLKENKNDTKVILSYIKQISENKRSYSTSSGSLDNTSFPSAELLKLLEENRDNAKAILDYLKEISENKCLNNTPSVSSENASFTSTEVLKLLEENRDNTKEILSNMEVLSEISNKNVSQNSLKETSSVTTVPATDGIPQVKKQASSIPSVKVKKNKSPITIEDFSSLDKFSRDWFLNWLEYVSNLSSTSSIRSELIGLRTGNYIKLMDKILSVSDSELTNRCKEAISVLQRSSK